MEIVYLLLQFSFDMLEGNWTLRLRDISPTRHFAYDMDTSPTGHFIYWTTYSFCSYPPFMALNGL